MTPSLRIIAADLDADLGNRLVSLTPSDQLFFKGHDPLGSYLTACFEGAGQAN
jgi:hypothetical protein